MTTGIIDRKRLFFPGLAGLYETFSAASYSFMRFATGAVLIPHGIQKIMLGSAANLATVIDKQMGVSYPLIWAYFAIFAESVGAICLAVGLWKSPCRKLCRKKENEHEEGQIPWNQLRS